MPCSDICEYDGSERGILCSLCNRFSHSSCAGFRSARILDYLEDSSSGLRWFCPECSAAVSNICAVSQKSREAFSDISKDFERVRAKFLKLESLFVTADTSNTNTAKPCKKSKASSKAKSPPGNIAVNVPKVVVVPPSPDENSPDCLENDVVLDPPDQHISPNQLSESDAETPSGSTNSLNSSSSLSCPQDKSRGTSRSSPKKSSNTLRPVLKVVKAQKSLFLGRLSADTSELDIRQYLMFHFPKLTEDECDIRKFKFSYTRFTSSFKVTLPPSIFSDAVKPSFWPEGIVVHAFRNREVKNPNIGITLPSSNSSAKTSKN